MEAKNSKHLALAETLHWENSQRTRMNPWFFEGCKLPGTSGSLILIFFNYPEPVLLFWYVKYLELVVLWFWFFQHTQSRWSFDSDVSNTQNQILDSEFLNYLELVVIRKIKCPPNTGFLATFHLHTYMESSKFSYWKPMPCSEEYWAFWLRTWLIRKIWMEDKLD